MNFNCYKTKLDALYNKYNKREFVYPDPLYFLYNYKENHDMEIAGLIASCLAYGNVKQILKSINSVLGFMSPSPLLFLEKTNKEKLLSSFKSFKHRFTTGEELSLFLFNIKKVIEKYDSLGKCFSQNFASNKGNILATLSGFVNELKQNNNRHSTLLPDPDKKSALKRLNLYLRWMVRKDDVDVGAWEVSPAILLIPLDTHIYHFSRGLSITDRKSADLKTVLEITDFFKQICPVDPIKYDFSITRLGIREELNLKDFIMECKTV